MTNLMAEAETIDTSGSVDGRAWPDLSPFAQGYIAALLCSRRKGCDCCEGRGEIGGHTGQTPESFEWVTEPCPACVPGFSDLAPEALALILADCEAAIGVRFEPHGLVFSNTVQSGRSFWEARGRGPWSTPFMASIGFPVVTVSLNDAGKVVLL